MLKRTIKCLISIIIIAIGIILLYQDNIDNYRNQNKEKQIINNYIENSTIKKGKKKTNKKPATLAVLYIPKIKLYRHLEKQNSVYNDINKNIKTIKYDNPSKNNNTIILAAHSGTSSVSYFKKICKLKNNDYIYLYTKNKKYTYKVIKKYQVKKTGYIRVNTKGKTLVLTTCSMTEKEKQLIIITKQIQKVLF